MLLIGVSLSAWAQEAEDDGPSLQLLEFLGEWETESGEWVDPELFNEDYLDGLLTTTDSQSGTTEVQQDD